MHQRTAHHPHTAFALSSGEAEFHGLVDGGAGEGRISLLADLGMRASIEMIDIENDSSAALGMGMQKAGRNTVRHIALNQLWLQDNTSTFEIKLAKCKWG